MKGRDYLLETIRSLAKMSDGQNGDQPYTPENILGQAKANALKDVVCYRETTNQQLLKMYEKIYEKMYYDQESRNTAEQELKDYCINVMSDPEIKNDEKMQYVRVIDQVMCVLKNSQDED